MRRYDDPVEVHRGAEDDPDQFLWRGRLWQVREVVAHWVETGAWWARRSAPVAAEMGAEAGAGLGGGGVALAAPADLLDEREVWRVTAARGRVAAQRALAGLDHGTGHDHDPGFGVFDLVFSWADGSWVLARAVD